MAVSVNVRRSNVQSAGTIARKYILTVQGCNRLKMTLYILERNNDKLLIKIIDNNLLLIYLYNLQDTS